MIKNEQDPIATVVRNLGDHEVRITRLEEQFDLEDEKIRRINS